MNPQALEKKWQKKWEEARLFESEPREDQDKYFVNSPYPYMNGYLHLGHAFTYLRADMVSRYQRMKNKNVLFPFAFHCTGTPIVAAAQRVKEGEKGQINALKQMGLSKTLIKTLSDSAMETVAIFSALADKNIDDMIELASSNIKHWFLVPLSAERSIKMEALEDKFGDSQKTTVCPSMASAIEQALALKEIQRVVIFGSFYTVADASVILKEI